MSNRRSFIKSLSCSLAGLPLGPHFARLQATDWTDWDEVSKLYPHNTDGKLNFNCGSAGVQPSVVLDAYHLHQKALSAFAPYEVYAQHHTAIEQSKRRMADLLNIGVDEMALVRNTTEAINAILFGIRWEQGDEIVISTVDYPSVWNSVKSLSRRYGVVIKTVNLDLSISEEEVLEKYREQINSRSRLIIAVHITHREGHIMPVSKISAIGRENGIDVLVDGAHAVGQMEVDIEEIGCQYYATSLHKWLSAPLGCGLLYVQKDKIASIDPPTSYDVAQQDTIDKFTWLGTFAFEKWMTLGTVLDFQDAIGLDRKAERLRSMSTQFRDDLADVPNVIFAGNPKDYGGINAFRITDINNAELASLLMEDYGFHLKKVGINQTLFLRTSFNLHLIDKNIDDLVSAIKMLT